MKKLTCVQLMAGFPDTGNPPHAGCLPAHNTFGRPLCCAARCGYSANMAAEL